MRQVSLKHVSVGFALVAVLIAASVAAAQEAAEPAVQQASQAPAGVSTLVLLLGLAAVFTVAVVWIIRERALTRDEQQ